MSKRRRMLAVTAITWLSLVTTLVQSLSSQPFPDNSARGKAIRSSSAPVASPEEPTRVRRGSPQDVSFVSSDTKKRRKRPPTPLVDSTLLRFLSLQKTQQVPDSGVSNTQQTSITIQQQPLQPSQQQPLGQYNRHLVATQLSELQGVSPALAIQAGNAVQQHVLARTARRRLRLFLRKRDLLWDSTTTNSNGDGTTFHNNNNNNNNNMNGNAVITTTPEKDASNTQILSNTRSDLNQVIELLLEKGLTGTDICTIFTHTPSVALMRPRAANTLDRQPQQQESSEDENTLDSTVTRAFTTVLSKSLKLRKYDARKVLRNCPGLLTVRGSKNAQHVVTLLSSMQVSTTSLARDKNALPVLLSRSPAALFRLIAFLSSDAVRMNVSAIGPLLKRADCAFLLNAVAPVPRLQQNDDFVVSNNGKHVLSWGTSSQERREKINDVYRQMSNTAWTLRHEIGTKDLGKVIAAYPSVLLLDAETKILPTASYLMNDLGIWQDDLPQVLQLYPVLLGMDVEDMKRIVNYLLSLEVSQENLASIFRAFPSLFQLDIEKDMEPVVQFLREIGITNVGRFITRLPPILGYSVEDELIPKWEYLCRVSTQGSFELSAFPAYFSYPLDKRIKTRFEYLQHVKRIPTQLLSLDKVLRYGDKDFCIRVARDVDDGAAFMEFAKKRANARRNALANNKKPSKSKARSTHRKSANDERIT